ncbi:Or83c, partial [Drosophila busckii]
MQRPAARYHKLTDYINLCGRRVGLAVLQPRFKFTLITWLTGFVIVNYAIFCSLWICICMQRDWRETFKSCIMMGALARGISEYQMVIRKQPEIKRQILYMRHTFLKFERLGDDYVAALNLGVDRLQGLMRFIRNGYYVSYSIMSAAPLMLLYYNGTRMSIMQFEIPGVSLEHNLGFTITYLTQLFSMFVAGNGFYAGDLYVLGGLTQILTLAHIFRIKAHKLNAALERKSQARRAARVGALIEGDEQLYSLLLDLILWHKEFTKYCYDVNKLYYNLITTQVLTAGIGTLSTVVVILGGFHLISGIYFLVSVYSMFVYCVMGTKIVYAYEELYESICCINWQELNIAQRKMFGFMLNAAQRPHTIVMLGMVPLSVSTALQ